MQKRSRGRGNKLCRVGPITNGFRARTTFQAHYNLPIIHDRPKSARRKNPSPFIRVFRPEKSPLASSLFSNLSQPFLSKMADANNEADMEIYYNSEANTCDKRKREGKLRSKVWQHFTKLMKEDGSCEKCQCNHCQKLFTCSSKSGTTHLLRHITDGICPAFKKDLKDKTPAISTYVRGGSSEYKYALLPWKFDQGPSLSSTQQCVEAEALHERIADPDHPTFKAAENDNEGQTPVSSRGKLPQKSALKSQPKGETWMIEFKSCVTKLIELANGRIPVGSLQALAVNTPDYSIATTLKCLNEMEDIPQSSEMYLDAFEILQDAGERECFVCLPPEPRRRWLQRILHRRHPLRYSSSI